mmetsp:Transcript_84085/g.153538  ORF Transcript_84085/g.153538 Transcript_84085/m.153538 type:complete len:215 (-) Transcript_84085:179-823(-)
MITLSFCAPLPKSTMRLHEFRASHLAVKEILMAPPKVPVKSPLEARSTKCELLKLPPGQCSSGTNAAGVASEAAGSACGSAASATGDASGATVGAAGAGASFSASLTLFRELPAFFCVCHPSSASTLAVSTAATTGAAATATSADAALGSSAAGSCAGSRVGIIAGLAAFALLLALLLVFVALGTTPLLLFAGLPAEAESSCSSSSFTAPLLRF